MPKARAAAAEGARVSDPGLAGEAVVDALELGLGAAFGIGVCRRCGMQAVGLPFEV
jgi:hypothetical protein